MQSLRQQMLRSFFYPRYFSTVQTAVNRNPGDMSPQTRLKNHAALPGVPEKRQTSIGGKTDKIRPDSIFFPFRSFPVFQLYRPILQNEVEKLCFFSIISFIWAKLHYIITQCYSASRFSGYAG